MARSRASESDTYWEPTQMDKKMNEQGGINMKNKKVKMLALLLAAMMTFTACGQTSNDKQGDEQKQEESNSGESQDDKEQDDKEEVTWTADSSKSVSIYMELAALPGEDDMVLAELEKRTGVDIEMIGVLAGTDEVTTKLSTMLAGGEVPDIMWVSLSQAQELKDAGMLANVSDVLNAVAPNVIEETGDTLYDVPLNSEGEVYMIPNMKEGYVRNLNVRADWLENLNMEMPTDLESYREMLNAFTYDDPDGDGKDDTIGLEFCMAHVPNQAWVSVFGAYGIAAGKEIELEDGSVTEWVKHPRFMEAMTYIREVMADGVCEPEYVSLPSLTSFENLWTGVSGVLEWENVGPTNNWMPGRYTEDPVPTFCFPTIEGPYGDSGVPAAYPVLDYGWVFSASCENLEGAAKIADFCMTEEGSDLLYFGIEGVMYNWADKENGIVEYLGEYADSATHRTAGGFCYWGLFTPKNNAEWRTLNTQTREGQTAAKENVIDWAYIPLVSEVYQDKGADMDQIINEMLAELFTTEEDLQTVYDSYIERWENAGGTEWEAEVTAQWKELNK